MLNGGYQRQDQKISPDRRNENMHYSSGNRTQNHWIQSDTVQLTAIKHICTFKIWASMGEVAIQGKFNMSKPLNVIALPQILGIWSKRYSFYHIKLLKSAFVGPRSYIMEFFIYICEVKKYISMSLVASSNYV